MIFKSVNAGLLRVAVLFAAAAVLFACEAIIDQRGNLPEGDELKQVEPGKTDKATVQRLLGSPSSVAAFDPDTWYYISEKTKSVAFFKQETLDQQVVAIHFDKDGVVKNIDHKGLQDAETVTPNPNATPSRGREFSVIEQFLGSFGKYVNKGRTNDSGQ